MMKREEVATYLIGLFLMIGTGSGGLGILPNTMEEPLAQIIPQGSVFESESKTNEEMPPQYDNSLPHHTKILKKHPNYAERYKEEKSLLSFTEVGNDDDPDALIANKLFLISE